MRRKKKFSIHDMRGIGRRPNVLQIVPPRTVMRPRIVHGDEAEQDHELLSQPLTSPTGPGGAAGFQNVAGSQIPVPEVTNISYGQKTHPRFRGRGVYPTEASCRFPLIVLQQTT